MGAETETVRTQDLEAAADATLDVVQECVRLRRVADEKELILAFVLAASRAAQALQAWVQCVAARDPSEWDVYCEYQRLMAAAHVAYARLGKRAP